MSASSPRTWTPSRSRASTTTPTETTFVGRFNARSRVREGEVAEVAIDTRTLHFFDPGTGLGIYDTTRPKEDA